MIGSENKDLIERAWSKYPEAELTIKEIARKSQLPHWKKQKRNAVHIGIIRRVRGDRVIIVKHKISQELDMRVKFEDLTHAELVGYGFIPATTRYCKQCNEFSSRINTDGCCQDCNENNKERTT